MRNRKMIERRILTAVVFLSCTISVFAQMGANGTSMTFKTFGLKYGVCSSDAMYYSTKSFPNVFDPNSSGTTGVDKVYADKFGYWGTVAQLEQYSKNGYLMFNAAGILDYVIGKTAEIGGKQFRFGKLKDYETNFPAGAGKRNLGGVCLDVFEVRGGMGTPIGEHLFWKIGPHYAYGLQASVADFEEQTGTVFQNSPGYKHTYGGGAHILFHAKGGAKFLWRNSFFYNWHGGKFAGLKLPGSGFKIESMLYTGIGLNVAFYYQTTTMKSVVAEPWLYGEGTLLLPKSTYSNVGFSVSFSLPSKNARF